MLHETLEPGAALSEYIKSFWSIKRTFRTGDPPVEIMPDSYREVVFSFGKPCTLVVNDNEIELPKVFGLNLLNSPLLVRSYGELYILSVRLYPWATMGLFNTNEPTVALADVFADLHKELSSILSSTSQAMLKTLRAHFSEEIQLFETDRRLLKACQAILLNKGVINSSAVSDAGYSSERNIERIFKQLIGETPKALSRKVRFEFIRDFLWNFPDANLTNLAYDLNFTDLAHFSNEFRAFSGKSPKAFAADVFRIKNNPSQ